MPKAKGSRITLAETIGKDGYHLLSQIYADETRPHLRTIPAVDILRQVWRQHYYIEAGKISWRDQKNFPPSGVMIASPYDQVQFDYQVCVTCADRARCTQSKTSGRQITFPLQAQYEAMIAARQRQETDEFKEEYAARAGIEGTVSQAVFSLGMRRTRYRSGKNPSTTCSHGRCNQCAKDY